MADDLSFDQFIPKKKDQSEEISFDQFVPKKKDDHGLAERQAMSPLEKAIHPVTGGYWQAQKELSKEAYDMMASGVSDIAHPGDLTTREGTGLYDIGKGALKTGLGALGYIASPAFAALRSVATQPLEDVTGIRREYPEFAAGLIVPGGEERSLASLASLNRAGFSATRASEVADAARRAGIEVPRALTSESKTTRAGSQALAVAPYVGTPLREAVQAVPQKIGAGVEKIAGEFGQEIPQNVVGGGIEQRLSTSARTEAAAAQAKADAENLAATQKWEAANQAREQAISDRQAAADQQAEQTFGRVDPMEMGEDAINQVQAAETRARTAKEAAYDRVNELNARVSKDAFNDVRQTASGALKDAGYTIDPETHPNASALMGELDRLTGTPAEAPANVPDRVMKSLRATYGDNIPPEAFEALGFPGAKAATEPDFRLMGRHAPQAGSPDVSIQGVEHLRKRVGQMAFNAKDDADRAASNIIKNAFDDWYHNATENHLTPGSDPNALDTIRAAREANTDWRNRFGYNYGNFPAGGERRNAARLLNRMVTGDIGPEDVARNLVGAKPGTRGVSAPFYDAISQAHPNPQALRTNVRGAYFDRIAGEGRTPDRIASDINSFLPGRMGERLLEPHEHDLMRGFAEAGQRTPQALREAAAEAKATKPVPIEAQPTKAEQIAETALGRNRPEEKVFDKVDQMARTDIKGFARTWGAMSDANRNEFRGALLRKLGGTGDDFTAGSFVKNWDAYSPQAKAAMFSREHRQALDDFRTIAKEYGDNIKKYGNPSGTAQVAAWHKLAMAAPKTAAALFTGASGLAAFHPVGALVAGVGLRKLSRILARPEGAQQVQRWNRIAQVYKRAPNANTLAALQAVTRNINAQRD